MTILSTPPLSQTPTLAARALRLLPIALVIMFAAVLRLSEAFQPYTDVFSWRQASTAMMADNFYRESWNIFFPAVNWNGPEPAYTGREFQTVSYLAAMLYKVLGQKDWVGRGVSIAFSLWTVLALHRLTRRVWDEPRALATALMYAILPGAIFIDRSFLPDGAMLALSVTTCWLYVAYLQTGRRGLLVGTAAVGAMALLTKLPGAIILAPMACATVCVLRRRNALHWPSLRPILIALSIMLVPVVAYYAWAVYLGTHYPPFHVAGSSNWVWKDGIATWIDRGYYLAEFWGNARWWLWTWPVIGLMVLGLLVGPSRAADESSSPDALPEAPWLFHAWLAGCAVLYAIGARELEENVWNLHVLNVFAAAMAGQGLVAIASVASANRPRWDAVLRIAVVLGVVLWVGQGVLQNMYKPQHALASWQMGKMLGKISAPGDTVVTIADDVGDPIAIYYSHRRGWTFPPAHRQDLWKPWNLMPPPQIGIELFEDLRSQGADWLGIVTDPKDDANDQSRRGFWRNHPEIVEHINRTCALVEKTPFCVIYRIKTPQELTAATQPAAGSGSTQLASGGQ
jgi:hypothetical protein